MNFIPYQRARRAHRHDINLCRNCALPRLPGSVFCEEHLMKNRADAKAARDRRKTCQT